MVTVPIYQPNVSLRPDNQQDLAPVATPDAFGAGIGRGMQGVARGLDQAGDAFARMRDLEDTTRAKDADNAYSNWARERMYGEGGFMTMQGRSAVDARRAFEEEAEAKRIEFGKGLTGGAAQTYQTASQARVQSIYQQSIVHTANERRTWVKDASAARIETFANDALVNFNKPALVTRNLAGGLMELREQGSLEGWDADTLKLREAEFTSGVHKNVALRIAQDDPIAADAYVSANSGNMTGAHVYDVQTALETDLIEAQSKREAEAILQEQRGVSSAPAASSSSRSVGGGGPSNTRAFLIERLAAGHGQEHIDGLDESFATNLSALMQDAPPEIREGLGIQSGHRSVERQRGLYNQAVQRYGSPEAARKWVAPPGRSNHNHGQAVDLSYNGRSLKHAPKHVIDWVHQNAGSYGLHFPMSWENWHIEPQGTRGGGAAPQGGTVAPRNNRVAPRSTMPSFDEIETRLSQIADDDVREATRKRLYAGLEAQNRAYEAQEKAYKAELWNYIDQGATPDQVPMEVRQGAGMAAVSAAWGYLETVAKGREIESDPTLFYDMQRYAAMEPTTFANIDLNEYRDRLSRADLGKLTELQTGALTDERKAREDGLNLTTAFSQASTQLEALGISTVGREGSQREEAASRIAQFNNSLSEQMTEFKTANDGRAPTQVDIQDMINRLLLPIVIREPGSLFGDMWASEREGFAFEAGIRPDGSTVDVTVEYEDIPIDLRRGISLDIEREEGRKPSEEEVVAAYEKMMLRQ